MSQVLNHLPDRNTAGILQIGRDGLLVVVALATPLDRQIPLTDIHPSALRDARVTRVTQSVVIKRGVGGVLEWCAEKARHLEDTYLTKHKVAA